MDRNPSPSSVDQRLSLQNEILKRVEQFSGKMERKAEEVTKQLRELEDRAGAAERGLRNTVNAFRQLSNTRIVENRIFDEDNISSAASESSKGSTGGGVPAQSYEADILPRYKEALTLGLTSCRNHVKKMNKSYYSSSSFRKFGSARHPLPHVIGSEEYLHDNSCGLTDFAMSDYAFDFEHLAERKGIHLDAGRKSIDVINVNMFGPDQSPSEKRGNEPLGSAALEFKAMLEAALLNPYKFYNEESSSIPDEGSCSYINTEQPHENLDKVRSEALHAAFAHAAAADSGLPPTEGVESHFQGHAAEAHEVSSLLLGSLFDAEEDAAASSQKPIR